VKLLPLLVALIYSREASKTPPLGHHANRLAHREEERNSPKRDIEKNKK
jgi:hypothetical protein